MQATHTRNLQHHARLAEIPESWSKAYTHRKRRTLIARLALWGSVIALAVAVLMMASRTFG